MQGQYYANKAKRWIALALITKGYSRDVNKQVDHSACSRVYHCTPRLIIAGPEHFDRFIYDTTNSLMSCYISILSALLPHTIESCHGSRVWRANYVLHGMA
jgi:hypothetical protein